MSHGTETKYAPKVVPSLHVRPSGQNSKAPSYTLALTKGGKGTDQCASSTYAVVPSNLIGAIGYIFINTVTDPSILHTHATYVLQIMDARASMAATTYSIAAGNLITINFATEHAFDVGDHITVAGFVGFPPLPNGDYFVYSKTATSVTYDANPPGGFIVTADTPVVGVTVYAYGDTDGELNMTLGDVVPDNLTGGTLVTLYPTDGFDFSDVTWWTCQICGLPFRKWELIRHPIEGKFVCKADYNAPDQKTLTAQNDYRGAAILHAAEDYTAKGEWP